MMQRPGGRWPRHILLSALFSGAALLVSCDRSAPAGRPVSGDASAGAPVSAMATLDRAMRVVLLREVTECVISIAEPFDVVDATREEVLATIDHQGPLAVSVAGGAVSFTGTAGPFDATVIDLKPQSGGLVSVRKSDGLRRYRGYLRLIRRSADAVSVLNVVDVEDYLQGVIAAELPGDFEPAAFRAQAIAARTYAWYHKRYYGSDRDWDVYDDESSQMYLGVEAESRSPAAVEAVRATRGIVCTWNSPAGERIFPAYYSSTCGGVSGFAEAHRGEPPIPVLAGDVRCDYCADSPAYRWGPVTLTKRQITARLSARFPRIRAIGAIDGLEITGRTSLGRPVWVEVYDDAGRRVGLDMESFRLGVDPAGRTLRSGYFTPVIGRDVIHFIDGRGFGHGMGLCQYGANGQAKAGKNAVEILRYYYPGCGLARAY